MCVQSGGGVWDDDGVVVVWGGVLVVSLGGGLFGRGFVWGGLGLSGVVAKDSLSVGWVMWGAGCVALPVFLWVRRAFTRSFSDDLALLEPMCQSELLFVWVQPGGMKMRLSRTVSVVVEDVPLTFRGISSQGPFVSVVFCGRSHCM